jgi:lactate racemase
MQIDIPYGKEHLSLTLSKNRVSASLRVIPANRHASGETLIRSALSNPLSSKRLSEYAAKADDAVIITSDHTRPMPSKLTIPLILKELRKSNPRIKITILVGTGCHRPTTKQELLQRFGKTICQNESIIIHDCDDKKNLISLGTLPSGGELIINKKAVEADLLIAEGFIEPHFFAGFSGGSKAVLPGIAGRKSVLANHCAKFISHSSCRAGIIDGNPIQRDIVAAAKKAQLKFIINVILDEKKNVRAAFAGDPVKAHQAGCKYVMRHARVKKKLSSICITSNGGYPLDQNIYQAVKGMTAAEATTVKGGVIIIACECSDGIGGDDFYQKFKKGKSPREILNQINKISADKTRPDQWQAQILARVLCKCRAIMVSHPKNQKAINDMFMQYASSLERAVEMADAILGGEKRITVIPDGVGVIVR